MSTHAAPDGETTELDRAAEGVAADLGGEVRVELTRVSIVFARPSGETLDITRDLDLQIRAGRMHCLAGRSGSGKTSIIAVAAGLSQPTDGAVRWDGVEIGGLSDDDVTRRRAELIGYADQRGSMLAGLTTVENVLIPAVPTRQTRARRQRALDLLARLQLADRAHYRPEILSGGERQRACLARALLTDPPVLIIDEPTSNLDRATADAVIAILAERAASGAAVLVASHDPHLIARADTRTTLEPEQGHTSRNANPDR